MGFNSAFKGLNSAWYLNMSHTIMTDLVTWYLNMSHAIMIDLVTFIITINCSCSNFFKVLCILCNFFCSCCIVMYFT